MIKKRVEDRENLSGDGGGDFLDVLLDHCQQDKDSVFSVESIKPLILVINSITMFYLFIYLFFIFLA
jgi:hypothetical protein